MVDAILLLLLDGPMQSWGHQSMFDRRTSLGYPTRSGLIGMFAAALGIDRGDGSALARFKALTLEVVAYPKVRVHGRASPPNHRVDVRRWVDYHTVGGGYDRKTQARFIVPKADSGKPGDTVVTYREYLSDACFVVFTGGPTPLLEELDRALRNPRWGIWLGRKCCVPSFPVTHGVCANRDAALGRLGEIAQHRPLDLSRPIRTVKDADSFETGTDTLMDVPLDFASRRFAPRRVDEQIG